MSTTDFIKQYEAALAAQDWKKVESLLLPEACVTFSNGTSHKGREQVQKAFEGNFEMIEDETYTMSDVHIITETDLFSVFTFRYDWSGNVNDQFMQGHGLGTSSLVKVGDEWKLIAEHLGPGG